MSEFWCIILDGSAVHPKYHQPLWGELGLKHGVDAWMSTCGQIYKPGYRVSGGGLFRRKTAERFADPCLHCFPELKP